MEPYLIVSASESVNQLVKTTSETNYFDDMGVEISEPLKIGPCSFKRCSMENLQKENSHLVFIWSQLVDFQNSCLHQYLFWEPYPGWCY